MLAVLDRYKGVLIILAVIAIAILLWLLIGSQSRDKAPSKGVFVLHRTILSKEGGDDD